MFRRRSDILHPLTSATSNIIKKFSWNPEMNTSFNHIKCVISQNLLLVSPNFNIPFEIYTDASDFQLGSVIVQDDRP